MQEPYVEGKHFKLWRNYSCEKKKKHLYEMAYRWRWEMYHGTKFAQHAYQTALKQKNTYHLRALFDEHNGSVVYKLCITIMFICKNSQNALRIQETKDIAYWSTKILWFVMNGSLVLQYGKVKLNGKNN